MMDRERDVRFFSIDCSAYATTCAALLPDTDAIAATGGRSVAEFYAAGPHAGNWACPNNAEMCDQAYPRSQRLVSPKTVAGDDDDVPTAVQLQEAVASVVAEQRGFPLPKLAELAGDFVRVAVMRSGDVDGDEIEQALLAKAKELADPESGEYGSRSPQHAAAAQHFVNAMKVILERPSGSAGKRVTALSQMGNQAAAAAKGNHASLDSYVSAKARDYAIKAMTGPLLGK